MRKSTLALAVPLALALSACSPAHPKKAFIYRSVDACVKAGVFTPGYCQKSYDQASAVAVKAAPKYASVASCEKRWGKGACQSGQPIAGTDGTKADSYWLPVFTAWMVIANEPDTAPLPLYNDTSSGEAQLSTSSGRSVAGPADDGETTVDSAIVTASEEDEVSGQTVSTTAEEPAVETPAPTDEVTSPTEEPPAEVAPVEAPPVEVAPVEE